MGSVQIRTTRLDVTAHEALTAIGTVGAAAFGYTAELTVDRRLAQLLRLRVAQVNGCTYCLDLHHGVARRAGVPQVEIDCLGAWWETLLFSEADQAALAYAEALTRTADTTTAQRFQQYHDRLAEHFDQAAMLEIVGIVVNMNVWTRLKLAAGAMPSLMRGAPAPSGDGG